jgi:enolase
MSARIATVRARQVLDSRGRPTVEAEVLLDDGSLGRAIAPSGASVGKHEAIELRDGDPTQYGGLGVRRAVENVNTRIASQLRGADPTDQKTIDNLLLHLDGTPTKANVGANAIVAVSLATAQAAAVYMRVPLYRYLNPAAATLPLPMVNIISGGLHASSELEIQDFLVVPLGVECFSDALSRVAMIRQAVGAELEARKHNARLVADEGGFGPALASAEEALAVLCAGIERAGLCPGVDAAIAIDVAATHFSEGSRYRLGGVWLDAEQMIEQLQDWIQRWPIISLEDPLAEDDWQGWQCCTRRLAKTVQLVGDDLFVTNAERIREGVRLGIANAVLIKVNQAGTLTETMDAITTAHSAGYRCIVSARSGETEDTFIADLAVATEVGQIKIGSLTRSERLAKYNQLLRIEEDLGAKARLAMPLSMERWTG